MFFKRRKKRLPPEKDPHSLGNIAVREGHVTQEAFDELLIEFKNTREQRIGQFLIERNVITKMQLQALLLLQVKLRKAEAHTISLQALALAQASQDEVTEEVEAFLEIIREGRNHDDEG